MRVETENYMNIERRETVVNTGVNKHHKVVRSSYN